MARRTDAGASRPRPIVLAALGYLLYLPVLAGFLLHSSPPEGGWRLFGKYSPAYAAFLACLLVPAVVLPWLARALSRPTLIARPDGSHLVIAGWRKVGFACVGAVASILAAAVVVEVALAVTTVFSGDSGRDRGPELEVFFGKWPWRTPYNPRGWNGPNITLAKPPDTYRIFFLGGSTTFLVQIDPNEWFSTRLGQSLQRARPTINVQVINAASGGHNTFHSLMKYAVMVQDARPDVVVVMHAINDMDEGIPDLSVPAWVRPLERDYGDDAGYLRYFAQLSDLGRPQEPFWRESRVGRALVQGLANTFLTDLRGRGAQSGEEQHRLAESVPARSLPAFRRNLRTLGELVQADGAQFIIASQPTMHRPGGAGTTGFLSPGHAAFPVWADANDVYQRAMIEALRQYNYASREVAAELGARFVDLEEAVPPKWDYFQPDDPIHLNAAGCSRVAEVLQEALLPLIPPTPPAEDRLPD